MSQTNSIEKSAWKMQDCTCCFLCRELRRWNLLSSLTWRGEDLPEKQQEMQTGEDAHLTIVLNNKLLFFRELPMEDLRHAQHS